jgi:hypothetical protein
MWAEVGPQRTLKDSGANLELLFIEELIHILDYLLN